MECRACGLTHKSWVRCEVAKRLNELEGRSKADGKTEQGQSQGQKANGEQPLDQPVIPVADDKSVGCDRSERRPGFDRVKYQREYMRKWRAAKLTKP